MTVIFLIAGAFLAVWLLETVYRRFWSNGLTVNVKFQSAPVFEGNTASLTETIENKSWLFMPVLQVGFRVDRNLKFPEDENAAVSDMLYERDVFSVMFYQKITRKIQFEAAKRGYYMINKVELMTKSLLADAEFHESAEVFTYLYVYPRMIGVDSLDVIFRKMMGEITAQRRLYEDPFAFRGLREYTPGDPLNKINWKASARAMNTLVNDHDSTESARCLFLLDIGDEGILRFEKVHEEGIRLAASLGAQMVDRQIPVGLLSNGTDQITGETIYLEPGSGQRQKNRLFESLARLKIEENPEPFHGLMRRYLPEITREHPLCVLITRNQRPELVEAVQEITRTGASLLWIATVTRDIPWKLERAAGFEIIHWEVRG